MRRTTRKIFTFTDIKRLSNKAANFFKSLGREEGQRGDAHPPPPVGVLGVRHGLAQTGGHPHPRHLAADEKGHRLPGQTPPRSARWCASTTPSSLSRWRPPSRTSPPCKTRFLVAEQREGWLDLNEELEKFPDTFPRPTGQEATRWGRHYAGVLHLWHHGHAQDGAAQLLLPPGAHCHRQVLAAGGGEQACT